jgi:hypothetical protein
MKLLHVYGDDDYAVLTLQQSDIYQAIWGHGLFNHAMEHGDKDGKLEFDTGCFIQAIEFPGVVLTDEFIEFLNDKKDYDSTKHSDWFIIEKE